MAGGKKQSMSLRIRLKCFAPNSLLWSQICEVVWLEISTVIAMILSRDLFFASLKETTAGNIKSRISK